MNLRISTIITNPINKIVFKRNSVENSKKENNLEKTPPKDSFEMSIGYINDIHGQTNNMMRILSGIDGDLKLSAGDNDIGDEKNDKIHLVTTKFLPLLLEFLYFVQLCFFLLCKGLFCCIKIGFELHFAILYKLVNVQILKSDINRHCDMTEELQPPANYQPIIWTAAENGDLESVKYTISKYPQCVSKPDLIKQTPLHWAARSGRYEVCKFLVEHGADVNARTNDGSTPLHWAAIKGQPRICRLLIEHGANVNLKENDGDTPLHYAAYCSNLETVKLLVKAGADIEAQLSDGSTPISMATNDDVMDYLLKQQKKKEQEKVQEM